MFEDIGKAEDSGVGSELQYFVEKDQCIELLLHLCCHQSKTSFQTKYDEYNKILLKYLEQPLLLNSHIVDLVQPMNDALLLVTSNRAGKEVDNFSNVLNNIHRSKLTIIVFLFIDCRQKIPSFSIIFVK